MIFFLNLKKFKSQYKSVESKKCISFKLLSNFLISIQHFEVNHMFLIQRQQKKNFEYKKFVFSTIEKGEKAYIF